MEKQQVIDEFNTRINHFFETKAAQQQCIQDQIKLIVSIKNEEIQIECWGKENKFLGYPKLDEVLNIKIWEKLIIDSRKITEGIKQSIQKLAVQLGAGVSDVQLMIKQKEQYILLHRAKHQQITLNDIHHVNY